LEGFVLYYRQTILISLRLESFEDQRKPSSVYSLEILSTREPGGHGPRLPRLREMILGLHLSDIDAGIPARKCESGISAHPDFMAHNNNHKYITVGNNRIPACAMTTRREKIIVRTIDRLCLGHWPTISRPHMLFIQVTITTFSETRVWNIGFLWIFSIRVNPFCYPSMKKDLVQLSCRGDNPPILWPRSVATSFREVNQDF
jgi:hypothetical protein